jgi:hypothetical protein
MKKQAVRRRPAKSPRRRKPVRAHPRPTRVGSWRTALTEAEAARRHLAQAAAAVDHLTTEMAALRSSAAQAARLELSRALQEGADGGPLTLLTKLAASEDPGDAPLARIARLIGDRLASILDRRAAAQS